DARPGQGGARPLRDRVRPEPVQPGPPPRRCADRRPRGTGDRLRPLLPAGRFHSAAILDPVRSGRRARRHADAGGAGLAAPTCTEHPADPGHLVGRALARECRRRSDRAARFSDGRAGRHRRPRLRLWRLTRPREARKDWIMNHCTPGRTVPVWRAHSAHTAPECARGRSRRVEGRHGGRHATSFSHSLLAALLAAFAGAGLMGEVARAASPDTERMERNRALVAESFEAWRKGTGGPFDLLADDASWTITGNSITAGTYRSKAEFIEQVIR